MQWFDPTESVPPLEKTVLVSGVKGRTPVVIPARRHKQGWKPLVPSLMPDKIMRWAYMPDAPEDVHKWARMTPYERSFVKTVRQPSPYYVSWLKHAATAKRSQRVVRLDE